MGDRLNTAQRSAVMSRIRSKNTRLEIEFRNALRRAGLRPTSGDHLLGKPDFVFSVAGVVVFLDSCFWHGCRWHCRMPGSNTDYWNGKIDGNKQRDKAIVQHYLKAGWKVIRIWEHSFKKHPLKCLASIQKAMNEVCKLNGIR